MLQARLKNAFAYEAKVGLEQLCGTLSMRRKPLTPEEAHSSIGSGWRRE